MKKLSALLVLFLSALGMMAQTNGNWSNTHDTQAQGKTVVFAALQFTNASEEVYKGKYTIAAFVGEAGKEECRLVFTDDGRGLITLDNLDTNNLKPITNGQVEVQDPTQNLTNAANYLTIQVPGNYDNEDDNKKRIIFMVKNANGEIYQLKASTEITFKSDGDSYGKPSDPVQLSVTFPTSYSMPSSFDVNVKETVNLRNLVTVKPEGAAIPQNAWKLEDVKDEATLSGDVLTGVKPIKNAKVSLMNAAGDAALASSYFNVLQPATEISIVTSTYQVELNDQKSLTAFMQNTLTDKAYRLTPDNSTDIPQWEIEDESYITRSNETAGWTPVKKGKARIRPFITVNNQPKYPANNQWITVDIVVPITSASLRWDTNDIDLKCNVSDDIYNRIASRVVIEPSGADQTFTVSVSSDDAQYFTIGKESIKVNKAPEKETQVILIVTPTGTNGEQHTFRVPVSIDNLASTLEKKKDALTFLSSTATTTVQEAIKDNVTYGPAGTGPNITFTAPGTTSTPWLDLHLYTTGVAGRGDLVLEDGDLTLSMEPGSHVVTATLTYPDYSNYYGKDEQIKKATKTVSFTVEIQAALQNLIVSVTPDETDPTKGTITLKPNPSNASYNLNDFTFNIVDIADAYTTSKWNFITTTPSLDTKKNEYSYSNALPGSYNFTVLKEGKTFASCGFVVPAVVQLASGWQWKGNPYGTVKDANQIKTFFTNNLVEARTYTDLLYNDPSLGFVGSFTTLPSGQMYKAKMNSTATSYLYGEADEKPIGEKKNWVLVPGWNWVASPYFYDHLFENAFISSSFVKGMVIVSKTDGFIEYNGSAWEGKLKLMKAGQGYLVYNPGKSNITITNAAEGTLPQLNETAGARNRAALTSVWQYDHSRFANNMTMVAEMPQLQDAEQYTIGAFVDGECRGEGDFENGHAFITVHCNSGEQVTFRLHNELTDEYFDIDQIVSAKQRVGSLSEPFRMTSEPVSTGIRSIQQDDKVAGRYDLNGRIINTPRKGVSIQRKADGKVMKVVVK